MKPNFSFGILFPSSQTLSFPNASIGNLREND
jgi:hypothetical protein